MQPPPIGIPDNKAAAASGVFGTILQKKTASDAGFHIVHINLFLLALNFGMLCDHIPAETYLPLDPLKKGPLHIP